MNRTVKTYFTTPIFYVNGKPHLGHAYTATIADILTRLNNLLKESAWLSTGTDEHGQKVAKSAAVNNLSPQEYADQNSKAFRDLFHQININYDVFVRTTSPEHKQVAIDFWKKLEKSGFLYQGAYEGWYLESEEAFCTQKLPGTVWMKEDCVFFRLNAFKDRLLEWYKQNPIHPQSAQNEVINLVKSDLRDLCISRKNIWGINVPDHKDYQMYVWVDALTNYITAKPDKHDSIIHIVGKDILRFHAIYWIAMLLATKQPLPGKIISHGWWIQNGEKCLNPSKTPSTRTTSSKNTHLTL